MLGSAHATLRLSLNPKVLWLEVPPERARRADFGVGTMSLRRGLARLGQQVAPAFSRSYATPGPVGACSGIPEEILDRKVRLYV